MVPPKLRFFLWLSMHNGLPTRALLYRRRSAPFPVCHICLCQDESLEHLFFRCPWVWPIWFGSALNFKVDRVGLFSWGSWCQEVFFSNYGYSSNWQWVQSYSAFISWYIWKARCDFVFNKVPLNPAKVLFRLSTALDSFLVAKSSVVSSEPHGRDPAPQDSSWSAPRSPYCKINVDASWSKSSLKGFVGVVVRAAEGRFVAAARYSICAPSAVAAEALALFHGCKLGSDLGFLQVILESDSLEVISTLNRSDIGS